MFHIVLHEPLIPPNTGNVIRMAACTGSQLHLVEPLGYTLSDAQLRRAGLDYHDMTQVHVHAGFDEALAACGAARVFAFTGAAARTFTEIAYRPGDALLFGKETTGLPPAVLAHPLVTARVRLPMVPGARSMNLSNSAAIATYEAWRQQGFAGAG
ncbi:MAG TPA: tRNA (cytidine(34)-2'-O)-methyltransferase [Actinomycetaceae bacterium]|nr:tRNA (cytidine(34)-2'-O)-methyltransferase [Actinomycetaceae bacterium]